VGYDSCSQDYNKMGGQRGSAVHLPNTYQKYIDCKL